MEKITNEKYTSNPVMDQPSRAEMKRRMDRLQDLGKRLTELSSGKLARIDLPEKLRRAVDEARRITAMGAIRRQIQYIGRIMEEFDTAIIARDLREIDLTPAAAGRVAVPAEKSPATVMAEELLDGGDEILFGTYAERFDRSQIQQMRQALRHALKSIASGKDRSAETVILAKVCAQFMGS